MSNRPDPSASASHAYAVRVAVGIPVRRGMASRAPHHPAARGRGDKTARPAHPASARRVWGSAIISTGVAPYALLGTVHAHPFPF